MKTDNKCIDFKEFLESFNKETLRCPECNSRREEIKLKDIPSDIREEIIRAMRINEFKENPTFVFCKKCDNYSILSSIKTGSKI
jgi:uncharacterized protein with PIN domain